MKAYDFGENREEWSSKQKQNLPVWQSPKYKQSKQKAIEIIEKFPNIGEGDFWILMNETKTGKMAYTGLIISHNACLKLNDQMPEDRRFDPRYLSRDVDPYSGALIYEYNNPDQMLYEVGEVSRENCKNSYPLAMAYKRCFDRVVLKLSKLAYDGVYSDSEAEEFRRDETPTEEKPEHQDKKDPVAEAMAELDRPISDGHIMALNALIDDTGTNRDAMLRAYGVGSLKDMTERQYGDAATVLRERKSRLERAGKVIGAE